MPAKASVATRTRSKTAATPVKAVQTETLGSTDNDHSPLSAEASLSTRRRSSLSKRKRDPIDSIADIQASMKEQKNKKLKVAGTDDEKRLRGFRSRAPQSYQLKLERALSQRMFVVGRTRGGTEEVPEELVEMAGTTGNIYSITIGLEPKCTCPDNKKGNQCKHIVYVLHNVLKAPEHLQYQLAFLSSELRDILSQAPLPTVSAKDASSEEPSNRKPIEGDCPICYTEFDAENEDIVWCKAACGNNIHKQCFEQWARSQTRKADVRCVYCRTSWQQDEVSMENIKKGGEVNEEGYVNVGGQLGLSPIRDTSTYHQPWLRQQYRAGRGVY
ncbi:MAG: hypothetical protein Q9179_006917 [Wetmoreana sp. 5 TL-2023]